MIAERSPRRRRRRVMTLVLQGRSPAALVLGLAGLAMMATALLAMLRAG